MDHAIYTAMGAARQSLELQAVTANNFGERLYARLSCAIGCDARGTH